MNEHTYDKGFAISVLIAIIAVAAVVGGIAFFNTQPEGEIMAEKAEDMMDEAEGMMDEAEDMMKEGEDMMEEAEGMMEGGEQGAMEGEGMTSDAISSATVIAGTKALLLEYNDEAYQEALAGDKLVVLYFYASWCPVCKKEFKSTKAVFDELNRSDVIGFRIHYNDNETTKAHEALAREFGVGYQHTKVFLKDGKRILKSPEVWDVDRYLEEIGKVI